MAMSKGFRVLEKSKPPAPHSVLLEHRNQPDALLFESQAVAVLCTYLRQLCADQKKLTRRNIRIQPAPKPMPSASSTPKCATPTAALASCS